MKCPVCKKNIPETTLKCPHCKSRIGLLCPSCNSINPVGTLICKNCSTELLKVCSNCNSVNFPTASKCRKCGSPFSDKTLKKSTDNPIQYHPKVYTRKQAFQILFEGLRSKDKKIFSISADKGLGKSTLLKKVITELEKDKIQWCIGKCTPLTQLTPGGVIQDMLLNLFKLPNYCINNNQLQNEAEKFFSKEFKFLNTKEVNDFFNFLYNVKEGNYEDIIINKKYTYSILNKIFDAFAATGKFIFVIDNFDFIDGFSIEFFINFIHKEYNWKNLKLIAIYNKPKPAGSYFGFEDKDINAFQDIRLAPLSVQELENSIKLTGEAGTYVSEREKEVIFNKSKGNPAFVEQAVSYCFDCQIADKAFLVTDSFQNLINDRLETLKKINPEAHKLLCGAAILGNKLNLVLLKEIFNYKPKEFNDVMSYLVKSSFIRPYNDIYYEFNNLLLWETILKNIANDSIFEDINIKIGKTLSVFTLNTNPTMAMISHNLKENRMAFDIWTKITRYASYIGDINLYVISQKQCLALLNEFNENETLNIRYNISEKLGKLLSEYDPNEAMEFLPDAISNAKTNNNDTKEIELLGYLAACCKKTGNYFGNVECTDNVLKKISPSQELETALIKASKLEALLAIGNCGEIINLIDNDIMPVMNKYLDKISLNKTIPLEIIFETRLKIYLTLASALAIQGSDRVFDVISKLFEIIERCRIDDTVLICKAKLVLAYANTIRGNYRTSDEILEGIDKSYGVEMMDCFTISRKNLIYVINRIMCKQYDGLRETLFEAVTFADNIGDNFTKNILKVMLGKLFKDSQQAKHAINIYNEQVSYFAKEKIAIGALLSWYYIAEATIITENPKNAIEIAMQALEIAENPKIQNFFFIVKLKMLMAQAYIEQSDYESAKINIESAAILAKKFSMNDLLSQIYYIYAMYNSDLGTVESQTQIEYLKAAIKMYEKALEIINKETQNNYLRMKIEEQKNTLMTYCTTNGFPI